MNRSDPLETIKKIIKERYPEAKAVFWAGSVLQKNDTASSDLDVVIVFDVIPHAYREAFIYDDWPIDAFIHDPDTIRYFFKKIEANDGRPALIQMILSGYEVMGENDFSKNLKNIAQEALNLGPTIWTKEQIDKERFLITDILDDIKFPKNSNEQIASAIHLFEPLIQFYFRAQNKWAASGKSLIRYLKNEDPALSLEFTEAFKQIFKDNNCTLLEKLIHKILAPYGGALWDGFKLDASKDWKA